VLGGVAEFDDGQVRLPALTSWLDWGVDLCRLFGYRVYGTPQGLTRVSAVRGLPDAADSVRTYTEGLDGFSWRRSVDLHGIVGWWEAIGPCATDADGQEVCIRSFPASVPSNPDVPTPPGTDADRVKGLTELLVTQDLADLARNVWEVDFGGRSILHEWTTDGQPLRRPGEVVTLDAPTVGSETSVWITRLAHDFTLSEGWVTSFTGWTGNGEALPSGSDVCVEETVYVGPGHVGDETVPWYAVPAPGGSTITVNFTPLDDYTSITLVGRHHGTNSQFIDGANADLTVSRFQLWQGGSQIGEGALPVADENYALQLDYTNDANWADFAVPIPGTLDGGVAAELRIVSGVNPALPAATDDDDFEVKSIVLTSCAQGAPTLPGEPTNPTIPPPRPPATACTVDGGSAAIPQSTDVLLATFDIPTGTRGVVVRATATGLNGEPLISGDPKVTPAQGLKLAGYPNKALFVPGTHTAAATGDLRVGGGTVVAAWDLGSPLGAPDPTTLHAYASLGSSGLAPAWSLASVCVTFTTGTPYPL
jgi:hypothetical protein